MSDSIGRHYQIQLYRLISAGRAWFRCIGGQEAEPVPERAVIAGEEPAAVAAVPGAVVSVWDGGLSVRAPAPDWQRVVALLDEVAREGVAASQALGVGAPDHRECRVQGRGAPLNQGAGVPRSHRTTIPPAPPPG